MIHTHTHTQTNNLYDNPNMVIIIIIIVIIIKQHVSLYEYKWRNNFRLKHVFAFQNFFFYFCYLLNQMAHTFFFCLQEWRSTPFCFILCFIFIFLWINKYPSKVIIKLFYLILFLVKQKNGYVLFDNARYNIRTFVFLIKKKKNVRIFERLSGYDFWIFCLDHFFSLFVQIAPTLNE